MVAAAPYIMMAAAAASAASSISQGNAQAAATRFNAEQATTRAQVDQQQADAQAAIDKQNTERQLGQAYANAGASGVDPGTGSPLAVLSDLSSQGELTRQLTLYRGKIAAWGDLANAQGLNFQAGQQQQAGQNKAATTLLSAIATYGMNSGTGGGADNSPIITGPTLTSGGGTRFNDGVAVY